MKEKFIYINKVLIKAIYAIILLVIISNSAFSQKKIAETPKYSSGTNEIELLIEELKKTPDAKGLIVIHSGEKRAGLGNILAHIRGTKSFIKYKGGKQLADRVSVVLVEGKEHLHKEFWIIAKGETFPSFETITIRLDNLKEKYFYAAMCSNCESFAPIVLAESGDFKPFADVLNKNPNYKGLIIVHDGSVVLGNRIKEEIVEEYGLNKNQIIVELGEDLGISHTSYSFFIVPPTY